jgi:hypothetical protein
MFGRAELKIEYKLATASAGGILLGLGFCAIDANFIDRGRSELGGGLSGLGAFLCFLSLLMFISCCISAAVDAIGKRWNNR